MILSFSKKKKTRRRRRRRGGKGRRRRRRMGTRRKGRRKRDEDALAFSSGHIQAFNWIWVSALPCDRVGDWRSPSLQVLSPQCREQMGSCQETRHPHHSCSLSNRSTRKIQKWCVAFQDLVHSIYFCSQLLLKTFEFLASDWSVPSNQSSRVAIINKLFTF